MSQPVKGTLRRFAPLTGFAIRPFRACDGGSGGIKHPKVYKEHKNILPRQCELRFDEQRSDRLWNSPEIAKVFEIGKVIGSRSADIIMALGQYYPFKMPETWIASKTENSEKP
jgi:hypothetical protein